MSDISVVILCGGKSSRMGQDKAELMIGEETFLEHSIKSFAGTDALFLSVSKRKSYDSVKDLLKKINITDNSPKENYVIEDIFEDCGPLGGLHASLKKCKTEKIFVTTVDLPFADRQLKEELESFLSPGIDAVVPVAEDGRLHPLCAVYRKNVESMIELQLEKQDYKVRSFLAKIRVCYVPVSKLTLGEKKLDNLNTPKDYARVAYITQQRRNSCGIPIVGIAAYSGSGKTTFLEKLIRELKSRKLRVAIIKHDGHDFTIDKEGKDTDRFAKAGADQVSILSATKAAKMIYDSVSVQEMIESVRGVDLILLEGFKRESYPKILLFREAAGKPVAMQLEKEAPIAIVSDKREWPLECPIYDLEDISQVADFLQDYIK